MAEPVHPVVDGLSTDPKPLTGGSEPACYLLGCPVIPELRLNQSNQAWITEKFRAQGISRGSPASSLHTSRGSMVRSVGPTVPPELSTDGAG